MQTMLAGLISNSVVIMLLAPSLGCSGEVENWLIYFKDTRHVRYEEPEVVAVGAKVELTYKRRNSIAGETSSGPVGLDSVISSNPEVIRVVDFDRASPPYSELYNGQMVLEAVGVGTSSIHVVDGSGNELTVTMHAAEAVELRFGQNLCVNGDQPPIIGQRIPIFYDLFDERGRKLYHYDMPQTPAYTVDPPGAIARKVAQGPAGPVTLESTIDDTHIRFDVIDDEDIENAAIAVGGQRSFHHPHQSVFVTIEGLTTSGGSVCQSVALNEFIDAQIQVLTPDICKNGVESQQDQFHFRFLSPGTCQLRFDLPRARGGSGITLTREFEVVPRPR